MNFIYKIRHKPTGLYYSGRPLSDAAIRHLAHSLGRNLTSEDRLHAQFNKAGKNYNRSMDAKNMLAYRASHIHDRDKEIFQQCEVIMFELEEKGVVYAP